MILVPFPWQSQWGWGFFSDLHCDNLRRLLEVKPMKECPQDWNPQEFFTLTLAHTQPRAIYQNYHLSDPTVYGSSGFCSRWADLDSLNVPDSRFQGGSLPSVFWLVQGNCWFSLYSDSSHCKDSSDNSQALSMLRLKVEVPPHLFYIILSVPTQSTWVLGRLLCCLTTPLLDFSWL